MMSLARPDPRRLPSRLRFQRPPLHALSTTDAAAPTAASCGALCPYTQQLYQCLYASSLSDCLLARFALIRSFNDAHRCIVQ